MEVICIEKEAYYKLLKEVIQFVSKTKEEKFVWINEKEAMIKLNISSKSTLQKLRDTDAIRFSQPSRKVILYDIRSIEEYLDKFSNRMVK